MCGSDQICMWPLAVEPKNTASAPTGTSAASKAKREDKLAATSSDTPSNAAANAAPIRLAGVPGRNRRARIMERAT